ncbi:MAG: response regulator [Candidatus Zixiibacteriota bacterium]|nr:MAG: response regulator [candidate division Zixibacteria bacterium]
MSIITVFSASYCHGEEVARETARQLGIDYIDSQVEEKASELFGVSGKKLLSAMYGSSSVIDKLSRGREKNIAYLRAALAELALRDNFVYYGGAGHLLPKNISHIMRICLVADHGFRVAKAVEIEKISEKEAASLIKKNDANQLNWTQYLFGLGPWDESLYDIVIPMHASTVDEAVRMICENARVDIVQTTDKSRRAMEDFVLASKVNVTLTEKKHEVDVTADDGKVIVILKKYVMRLEHYKEELIKLAETVPGVKAVEVRIGSTFRMPYAYPPVEFDVPKKVLLVDDEKEFVHTLSERLQTRHMEPSVVYDGEEALSFVSKDQPEVMVLDLKMPGIDGIEVLKKVKKDHPETEVIILTGHGSDRERQLAMELGAFAYLEKPVDINVLTETMTKAYAKIRRGSGSADNSD